MTSIVMVYDRKGFALAEFETNVNRTWKLNDYGQATFKLPTLDPKTLLKYFQFGNLLYVTHDKLPAWGGMIDPPRSWEFGLPTATAYAGEYLLKQMRGPMAFKETHPAGILIQILVEKSDGWKNWPVDIGSIWGGGSTKEHECHLVNLYDEIKAFATECKNDWSVTPALNGNQLIFELNFYEKVGTTRLLGVEEDINCKLNNIPYVEQGEIYNDWIGYDSTEGTWNNCMRSHEFDQASIDLYGPRYNSFSHTIGHIQKASDEATQKKVNKQKQPRGTFDLTILDVGDTFLNVGIGDVLPVKLATVGFSGDGTGIETTMRISGMTFDDLTNELEIVSDEEQ